MSNWQRRQRREIDRNKDKLGVIMYEFFEECSKKSQSEVNELYQKYERLWMEICNKVNNSPKKEAFLHIDAFEKAVKLNGHIKIKQANVSNKSKLQMLRMLHPIQNKSKLYFFLRDIYIWWRFLLYEYPHIKKAV